MISASADRGRDRSIDAVRAYAIVGVVVGHWLVTGLVVGPDGGLRPASPLVAMPQGAPATWFLQTLALFFFAAGFGAVSLPTPGPTDGVENLGPSGAVPLPTPGPTDGVENPGPSGAVPLPASGPTDGSEDPGSGRPDKAPVAARLRRLLRPVAVLAAGLAVVLAGGAALGLPAATLRTVASLVVDPLWFLLPYAALSAATGPGLRCLDRARTGLGASGRLAVAAAAAVVVVGAVDAGLLPGIAAVPAAWAVPWLLGVAVARGLLTGRRTGLILAMAGAAALTILISVAHYPASAVGVPGQARSNLSPPSLAAVALGVTQVGVFLLLRPLLARSRGAVALNRAAVPVYLGHQSVLLAAVALAPGAPGLIGAPDHPGWVTARSAWIPVFTLILALVVCQIGRRGRRHGGSGFLKWRLRSTVIDGS